MVGTGLNRRARLCDNRIMSKRPRDPSELAKQIFDIAIGEGEDTISDSKRTASPKREAGIKGGKARAKILTPEKRSKIAKDAAQARWDNA